MTPPPSKPLRILFAGTADIGCPTLEKLSADERLEIVAVVTQPDRPQGRKLELKPSPIKLSATRLGLPVWQPLRARELEFLEQVRGEAIDLAVVIAYGQIIPQNLLDAVRLGWLNVHTSILPKYRGAAPIQWAILEGESETGVTIMKMDAGLDTGPILAIRRTPITSEDDAITVHTRLARLGADLLIETLFPFADGLLRPQPQPEAGDSYARKIKKEDGAIDWKLPAVQIWNRVRALTPWPGTFTHRSVLESGLPQKKLLKIWKAEVQRQKHNAAPGKVIEADKHGFLIACGEDVLRVITVQVEGGTRLSYEQFLTGHQIKAGEILG